MFFKISRPYDSHTHLLGIAEKESHWNLTSFSDTADFAKLLFDQPPHRGDFYMGFGWNLKFADQNEILQSLLSALPVDKPVFLSRWDGHASFINAAAARKLGFGDSAKLLMETEHFMALKALPRYSDNQLESLLKLAKDKMHQSGFTHFRDMTSTLSEVSTWAKILNTSQDAFVEFNFPVFVRADLHEVIKDLVSARKISSRYLKIQGLKLFIDGTLGAQTAMTKCGCGAKSSAWSSESLREVISEAWGQQLDVAFHCIGELAVDQVVEAARFVLGTGITGRIHIEHCELLSKETLRKMKGIHVSVHVQPSHAIEDLSVLQKRGIPEEVLLFPIDQLLRNKVPVYFGSDAPVVESSMVMTLQGLRALKFTKPEQLQKLLESCHSHPDPFSPKSELYVDSEGRIQSLKFEDKEIVCASIRS